MSTPAPRAEQEALLGLMNSFPLHQGLGFELVDARDGHAEARVLAGPAVMNAGGVLHGGVLYAVMDITAFCAAVTVVPSRTNAATHDLHVQVLRATPEGSELRLLATVRKTGKRLVFVDVEALVGDQVVALGRVTKSLIPFPPG